MELSIDIVWYVVSGALMLVGIIGCFLPIVPGPPLAFVGLLVLELTDRVANDTNFYLLWAAITVAVTVLDYVVPIWGTKKFGGSKYGVWGSTIGLIVGLFFAPLGIIVGPFVGALLGEFADGKQSGPALKAAFGSFLGFLAGTLLKLISALWMTYYWVTGTFF